MFAIRQVPMFAALTMLLAACDRLPTPPNEAAAERSAPNATMTGFVEREVEEHLYDMTDSYFQVECPDGTMSELVAMEGKVYERLTTLRDAAGGIHVQMGTMPVGLRGVGVTTGREYRAFERDHISSNQLMSGYTGSYRESFGLVGKQGGPSFVVFIKGNYRITADDEVLVERERVSYECKL
jgi:hypothetical protein